MVAESGLNPSASPGASVDTEGEKRHEPDLARHVAIIMDGNGRWAQSRHLPRLAGHRAGVRNMHRIVRAAADMGIPMLTLYAFSTENWDRPTEEVEGLMEIFADAAERETRSLHKNGVCIKHIGSLENVPLAQRRAIERAVEITKDNHRLQMNVAFNYGGRAEVVNAVKSIVEAGTPAGDISETTITEHLYTWGMPDPDLVIRTAGEMRLSNFLIWQASYSEYYFSQKMWPDFGEDDFRAALQAYAARRRKFGRL
ncbi:MAG TPA: polyprenyl diphosphate synthase [Chloroflexota bacterium]|jgi:undecaprenyl diphosphate synthase|nr:polyprenyl diphosphate synthase [Chloroflexota bacterium]